MQDGVHEVAGAVSSKGAASAVGAVSTGRQAKDEDASTGITKTGYRLGPIDLVEIGTTAGLADAVAVIAQPRTPVTRDDVLINLTDGRNRKQGRGRRHFYL